MKGRAADNARPTVSIGVPVYNGQRYLRLALDALLAQTYVDVEIIISDNASTDATETICREYAEREPRIRYVRQATNTGAVGNFNRCFELATGKYFKWAAVDDLIDPTFIEKCVRILDDNDDVVLCHCQTTTIGPDGEVVEAARVAEVIDGESSSIVRRFHHVLRDLHWISRYYGLFRADALRNCLPLVGYYGSEKVQLAELMLIGRYHELREPLFFERIHPEASRNLQSAEELQAYCCPENVGKQSSTRWQLLKGYIRGVRRQPIGFARRWACMGCIVLYLFQIRKWRRVIVSMIRGTGTGEGKRTRETLQRLEQTT